MRVDELGLALSGQASLSEATLYHSAESHKAA
jgi:hypothetical protein